MSEIVPGPVYPRTVNRDYPKWFAICITIDGGHLNYERADEFAWPTMLGLLTIIGDAVRGVPWGKPSQSVASPVLPEVGSVWLRRGGSWPVVVMGAGPALQTRYVCMEGGGAWQIDSFYGAFIPATVIPTDEYQAMRERLDGISELEKRYSELRTRAARLADHAEALGEAFAPGPCKLTVIPTPTADAWRRVGDEQPDKGQVVFLLEPWSLPGDLPMLRRWISLHPDRPDDWLWQPVPPGIIPPPPADRDGGAS